MDTTSVLFAKLAGLEKNLKNIHWPEQGPKRVLGGTIEPLIKQYKDLKDSLIIEIPELYADLPEIKIPTSMGSSPQGALYEYNQVYPMIQSVEYILEVRANYRIGERKEAEQKPKRIFISHGRSLDWHKIQSYLDKDLGYSTLELAQEANLGRTVLQKLNDESSRCSCAVIIMTGDDSFQNEIRARENVMHEIGFFQGKYGLHNVIILHEEGVTIPSNISGLVYISFPRNTIEVTFVALHKELKIMLS